ncbi:MAG: class I SAM-dependent RNA methyltransferase [Candidatus Sericytochromatia bacterium]
MTYNLIATSAFGLESIVAQELKNFGYENIKIENSRVSFSGDLKDIAFCNINIRTSDRILIKVGEFDANTFDELFDNTKNINWSEFLPKDAKIHVSGKSVKSKLFSTPNCQAIVKKAIIENLSSHYKTKTFLETGNLYKIEVSILKDIALISLDTSGAGLHKRGYRELSGEAPLKETLACAIIMLSRWTSDRTLADLFCGSGTIPIEAAMIAKNIPVGLNRKFVSEEWDWFPKSVWDEVRQISKNNINDNEIEIYGYDIDKEMIDLAYDNSKKARVDKYIKFKVQDASKFKKQNDYGCIITNPPYGQRIGEKDSVRKIYTDMGKLYKNLENWSFFTLTANDEFERFFGKKADKNRKLFNGNIQCYLYQHFAKLPPKNI